MGHPRNSGVPGHSECPCYPGKSKIVMGTEESQRNMLSRNTRGYPDTRNFHVIQEKRDIPQFRRYRGIPKKHVMRDIRRYPHSRNSHIIQEKRDIPKFRGYRRVPEKMLSGKVGGIRTFGMSMLCKRKRTFQDLEGTE